MQYIVLRLITKNGIQPTNFAIDGLRFHPKNEAEPGVRDVTTEHSYGTYRVQLDDDDTLTVLGARDPEAADLR